MARARERRDGRERERERGERERGERQSKRTGAGWENRHGLVENKKNGKSRNNHSQLNRRR